MLGLRKVTGIPALRGLVPAVRSLRCPPIPMWRSVAAIWAIGN